jgi:hypothetical protein
MPRPEGSDEWTVEQVNEWLATHLINIEKK